MIVSSYIPRALFACRHAWSVRHVALVLAIASSAALCGSAHAGPVLWTVQSSQSYLQVGGTATLSGFTLKLSPQGAGADVAPISGTFTTDLKLGTSVDMTSSSLSLLNSGNWSPLPGGATGTAPADLGLKTTVSTMAARNVNFALDTPALALSGGPTLYAFTASGTTQFTGGVIDYFFGAGASSSDFLGSSGALSSGAATISIAGNIATLTMPVQVAGLNVVVDDFNTPSTTDDLTGVLNITGQVVATATVPEPSSAILGLVALSAFGLMTVCRRSRRQVP